MDRLDSLWAGGDRAVSVARSFCSGASDPSVEVDDIKSCEGRLDAAGDKCDRLGRDDSRPFPSADFNELVCCVCCPRKDPERKFIIGVDEAPSTQSWSLASLMVGFMLTCWVSLEPVKSYRQQRAE